MKLILFGVVFCFLETWYYGWNWHPSCGAERICDHIAVVLVTIGAVHIVWREIWKDTCRRWRRDCDKLTTAEGKLKNIAVRFASTEGALQAAYRKHHLGHDHIGWDELGGILCDVLCEVMGDTEFQLWLTSFQNNEAGQAKENENEM